MRSCGDYLFARAFAIGRPTTQSAATATKAAVSSTRFTSTAGTNYPARVALFRDVLSALERLSRRYA